MILYGDMIFNNISVSNMYIVSATRLPLESNRICLLNYVLRSFSIRKKNVKQTRSLAVNPNIKIAFTCLANILGLALDELSTGEAFPAKTTTGIRATECNRYGNRYGKGVSHIIYFNFRHLGYSAGLHEPLKASRSKLSKSAVFLTSSLAQPKTIQNTLKQ